MSRGLGKVELAILDELRQGDALDTNDLSIAVSGLKAHVISFPCNAPEWQSTARALRSLMKKGLVVEQGNASGKKLYKNN